MNNKPIIRSGYLKGKPGEFSTTVTTWGRGMVAETIWFGDDGEQSKVAHQFFNIEDAIDANVAEIKGA